MSIVDLHFHSNHSDGKLSVAELAILIKKRGLSHCSLTDHDTITGVAELIKKLQNDKIIVIPGLELTALYGKNEIHVLVYDFDIKEVGKIIKERNDLAKKQKIEEMRKVIKLFTKEGFKINTNLIPEEKKPVGYTLASDISKNKFNQDLFNKRHKKILTLDDIYLEYQAPGRPCAVERSGISVEWLLNKFKYKASDLIIAHPFLRVSVATNPLSESQIVSLLEMGFNGLEIYHDKTSEDQINLLKTIVNEKKINYTGGSDFHGRKDDVGLGLYRINSEITHFKLSNYKLI